MYERRLKAFLVLMALGVAALLARLVDIQWLRGESYRRRAEERLTWVELLPTVRGRLLDRKGRVLAEDRPCYELCLPYRMLKGPGRDRDDRRAYDRWVGRQVRRIARAEEERVVPGRPAAGGQTAAIDRARKIFEQRLDRTWEIAAEVTGRPKNEMFLAAEEAVRRVETIRRAVRRRTGYRHIRLEGQAHAVVGGLTEAEAVTLRCRMDEMIGSATVRPAHRRHYPFGARPATPSGGPDPVGPDEVTPDNAAARVGLRDKMAHYFPGDRIGKFGAEKLCEQMLRGVRGYRKGRRTGELLEDVPPWFGQSAHLTLDIDLQRDLRKALGGPAGRRNGAIVVLNVFDDEAGGVVAGEVLAMVSLPGFDLNRYEEDYRRLAEDRADLPLWNRAVAVRYPPGSTVKPLIALAALHHKIAGEGTTFHCKGYLHTPGAFRCWTWWRSKTGHGRLDLVGALEHSCNVYFYNLGERLGVRRQVAWLTQLGFADAPGTGLPAEKPGELPDPRKARYAGDARFLAIGQGKISATCMHVANAIAAVARGGQFATPVLVRELAHRQRRRPLGVSPQQVALIHRGMYKVVNSPSGTAYRYARVAEIELCGKTGTAETAPRRVDSNGNGRIDRGDRVVRSGNTAWFVGFAPYRRPRIAFAVVVEYTDAGGGATCGPIAVEVVRACRARGYL